ncbi:galactoside alpha-(1,2)-fucosyltransferase 1-like [Anomaloglossus baeobatrachus]|uniref:galactoside alpha-(1,2)-fucosyltransferase 1-like n=1 Tax=Anomaloglossus baeobatrachus TaxID=238106 RepID=UPI003F50B71D
MHWNFLKLCIITLGFVGFLNIFYLFRLHIKGKHSSILYGQYNLIMEEFQHSRESSDQIPMGMWTYIPVGHFGDFMSQYATLLYLSKLNGRQAYMMPNMHDKLSRYFKVKLPVIDQEVSDQMSWKLQKLDDYTSPEYSSIIGEYVILSGMVSSWTFYYEMREEVLQEFNFHDFIKDEVNSYLAKIIGSQKNVTYVGVHVRKGDYIQITQREEKAIVDKKQYIQKAMGYFRNKYESPVFVVTGNDMDWCKKNIDNLPGDVHFTGNETSPEQNFALLAHCNHTIMTIGSFGFWAAYLAGGETIYLTNFTDSPHHRTFKYEIIHLPV